MKNKDFQNKLAQYPDDVDVFVDKSFGWMTPSNETYEDPCIHEHSYEGDPVWGLEIATEEWTPMNIKTIELISNCINELGFGSKLSEIEQNEVLELFNKKYW